MLYFLSRKFKIIVYIPIVTAILFCIPINTGYAATKCELLFQVFGALNYVIAGQNATKLPPDVKSDHSFSNIIRSAVFYGVLPPGEVFSPDSTATRGDALYLALCSMGWRHEVETTLKLSSLPELLGSGDPILFMAAEISPPAPQKLLSDGSEPISGEEIQELLTWIEQCKKNIIWNRIFSYGGTELILFRQGIGAPGATADKLTAQPPLYISAIAVTPAIIDQTVTFAEPLGAQRVPLSQLGSFHSAIGAVNGGFFHAGRPIGTVVKDGIPLGLSFPGRSAIGWTPEGNVHFGTGNMRTFLQTPTESITITAYNVPPNQNACALYSPIVAPEAKDLPPDTLLLHINDGVVQSKEYVMNTTHPLPQNGLIVASRGYPAIQLNIIEEGTPVRVTTEWEHLPYNNCSEIIQAGPMLLKNGHAATTGNESFRPNVLEKRHSRTLVGLDKNDRMLWAVIDGRDPMHSVGATIDETRNIAQSLGLVHALNLDGGGSSTLWWRGVIINKPSDGKERPIPYGIIMRPKPSLSGHPLPPDE